MLKKNYRKRIAKKPYRKRVAGGRKASVSAGVKNYVKKIVHAQIENKSVQVNQQISFGSYAESPEFNAFPMLPQTNYWTIAQTAGAGGRIGNQVKIRSVHLNYVLRPLPYDLTFNPNPSPVQVLMYLGYVKNSPSFIPIVGDFSYFYQSGSSSISPFGTLRDSVAIINSDYWVIKKRWSHKIGFAENSGTGASAGGQYATNNDFKMNVVKRMDITSMCPKTCTFNDGSGGVTNKNLYLMYEAVLANGNTTGAQFLTANIDYWIDFVYEDA